MKFAGQFLLRNYQFVECTNWQIHLNFLKKLHSMWFVCMGLGIRDDMAFWDIVVGPFELKGPSIKDVRKISGFFDPLPPCPNFG